MKTSNIKSIIPLIVFLVCFFVCDYLVGLFFDSKMKELPDDGERFAKTNYVVNKVHSSALIIGSSRAETAYNSKMLNDSLEGYQFYNCGGDAQDFYYCNTIINCILDRYVPNLIIWDFKEKQLGGDDSESLSLLYPFYWHNETIREALLQKENSKLKFLMLFNAYRFNATAGRILRSIYRPDSHIQNNLGFGPRPLRDSNEFKIVAHDFNIGDEMINTQKVRLLQNTLKRANNLGCRVIIVISPMFNKYNADNVYTRELSRICLENNVDFLDFSHVPEFVHNDSLSYDDYHLNYVGADMFTSMLSKSLRNILSGKDVKDHVIAH